MKWVWVWDALWIIVGMVTWLKRPRVPAELRLTPEQERESRRAIMSRVTIRRNR